MDLSKRPHESTNNCGPFISNTRATLYHKCLLTKEKDISWSDWPTQAPTGSARFGTSDLHQALATDIILQDNLPGWFLPTASAECI